MKFLFLDDDFIRIKQAKIDFAKDELSVVETAEQAINLLEKDSPYDMVSLDHDLGGKIYCPSDDVSGFAVAQYISKMHKEQLPKQVIIHSFNPDGTAKMMRVLQGIVPVIQQPFHINKNLTSLPSDLPVDDLHFRLMHWSAIHTLRALSIAQRTNLMQFAKQDSL